MAKWKWCLFNKAMPQIPLQPPARLWPPTGSGLEVHVGPRCWGWKCGGMGVGTCPGKRPCSFGTLLLLQLCSANSQSFDPTPNPWGLASLRLLSVSPPSCFLPALVDSFPLFPAFSLPRHAVHFLFSCCLQRQAPGPHLAPVWTSVLALPRQ
jgi:hypothetical protein